MALLLEKWAFREAVIILCGQLARLLRVLQPIRSSMMGVLMRSAAAGDKAGESRRGGSRPGACMPWIAAPSAARPPTLRPQHRLRPGVRAADVTPPQRCQERKDQLGKGGKWWLWQRTPAQAQQITGKGGGGRKEAGEGEEEQ